MSSVTYAPANRVIYRKSILFCVLPVDLSHHLGVLQRYCAELEGVEIVVESRAGTDRRQRDTGAPDGGERRLGDRRQDGASVTATEFDFDLPRSLRRHADRIICTWRSVPVHFQDAACEADLLLAAADTDRDARDELRLRYYQTVYTSLGRKTASSRRRVVLVDSVFDDLFASHESNRFNRELGKATARAKVTRWPRHASSLPGEGADRPGEDADRPVEAIGS